MACVSESVVLPANAEDRVNHQDQAAAATHVQVALSWRVTCKICRIEHVKWD